ncbi:MAG: EpsI family protein [Syntrophaceae bacterium]|nr:EpsI family protein [Syntrophaceae bacterium]
MRVVVLSACLIITGWLVHRDAPLPTSHKTIPLQEAMANINGWEAGPPSTLDNPVVEALELDDYLNRQYRKGNASLVFYIGYYLTAKKIGAAHDPMVCFPGQGWQISDRSSGQFRWQEGESFTVNYSSMIGTLGNHRELIVYWFQSYGETSKGTFLQKVKLLENNILRRNGDNAFCRVTVSLDGTTTDKAMETAYDFIKSAYPAFLNYTLNG